MTILSGCAGTEIPKLEGAPLDPNVHRAHIVAIDAILFEDGGLTEDARQSVSHALISLSEVVSTDETNTIAVRLGQDMRTLSAMAARTKIGTPLSTSPLRRHWLRIRASLFEDASWFRRSSADPIEPAVAGPPPPSPLRAAAADERKGLDQTLLSLTVLIERAKRDLPNGYDSEPHRQFVIDAERELAVNVARLGAKPPTYGIDVYYQDAHRYAAEAIRVMQVLTTLGTGAPTSSREYLIRKADDHVRKALDAVAEMR